MRVPIDREPGKDGTFHNVHTPGYDFNDAILPLGVAYWVALVQKELGPGRT
jgi:metal-dependent amidase/aminoacylase/carboxypeptidase family protein